MKLLSLFLIVKVVAAASWRPVGRFSPASWYIADKSIKDAAGCNSSWSTVPAVQTIKTRGNPYYPDIYIDTLRHGGSTGDNKTVCLYKPPHFKRRWWECKDK